MGPDDDHDCLIFFLLVRKETSFRPLSSYEDFFPPKMRLFFKKKKEKNTTMRRRNLKNSEFLGGETVKRKIGLPPSPRLPSPLLSGFVWNL